MTGTQTSNAKVASPLHHQTTSVHIANMYCTFCRKLIGKLLIDFDFLMVVIKLLLLVFTAEVP